MGKVFILLGIPACYHKEKGEEKTWGGGGQQTRQRYDKLAVMYFAP